MKRTRGLGLYISTWYVYAHACTRVNKQMYQTTFVISLGIFWPVIQRNSANNIKH